MKKTIIAVVALVYVAAFSLAVPAQQRADDGPQFTSGNTLMLPANYREWVFLSSGLGMTYNEGAAAAAPRFDNVYVNPSSYRSFLQTGEWPDRTMLILEQRESTTEGSIVEGGRFQTTVAGLEAHGRDARLPDGWAFFFFGAPPEMRDAVAPLPPDAAKGCVDCHKANTAVERTFVQFYPTLLDVARAKGTLKPGF
jgi:hypothetical protein